MQWLNPEGFVDVKTLKKVDPAKAIAEYVDVASVRCEANLIQGLAGTLGFECDYRNDHFVIAAKAGLCLGLGGSGSVGGKVGVAEIAQFFLCIAHQLKQADYKKLAGLMNEKIFALYNQILYLITIKGKNIEEFVGAQVRNINQEFKDATQSLQQKKDNFIDELYKRMMMGHGFLTYMPPESRGAVIRSVVDIASDPAHSYNTRLRENAAFVINEVLATTQSPRHLDNTLDRISLVIGEQTGRQRGVELIDSVVADTRFAGCINRCEMNVASAMPLFGRPFLRNDMPEFVLAKFPLNHSSYSST